MKLRILRESKILEHFQSCPPDLGMQFLFLKKNLKEHSPTCVLKMRMDWMKGTWYSTSTLSF